MRAIEDLADPSRLREKLRVDSNRKLMEIFEAKIKAKLDEIWGETHDAE